jgi:hypothetical protein
MRLVLLRTSLFFNLVLYGVPSSYFFVLRLLYVSLGVPPIGRVCPMLVLCSLYSLTRLVYRQMAAFCDIMERLVTLTVCPRRILCHDIKPAFFRNRM